MTQGSQLYSDLYVRKLIIKMKERNTICNGILFSIAYILMIIGGITNLLAIEWFKDFFIYQLTNNKHIFIQFQKGDIWCRY